MPQKNSLHELIKTWGVIEQTSKNDNLCLLSYRPDRSYFKQAMIEGKPEKLVGVKNSFLGFHFLDLPEKTFKYVLRRLGKTPKDVVSDIKHGKVTVAPYGGMFFHKNLIKKIGLPKEEFFVYADDHEWSYRITMQGGQIQLVLDSMLEDIDISWNVPDKKVTSFTLSANGPPFRVYYSTRNRVSFEVDELVSNYFVYKLNIHIYRLFLFLIFPKMAKSTDAFHEGLNDGLSGKLGKNTKY
jgi:hypothetical protein